LAIVPNRGARIEFRGRDGRERAFGKKFVAEKKFWQKSARDTGKLALDALSATLARGLALALCRSTIGQKQRP
jgi:hypothetical protein